MSEEEPKEINLDNVSEYPPMAVSQGSIEVIQTGDWKYAEPIYQNKLPPCNSNCPAGEDIVKYLMNTARGEYEKGWLQIVKENPFPGVCGRVCPHFCETDCNREQMGGPINIHSAERFLAENGRNPDLFNDLKEGDKDKSIAVIGSGPAGLTCSYHLALKGYNVKVFEAKPEPGGYMQYGIPSYRLPREVLEREISDILSLGVEIETGTKVGKDVVFDKLTTEYDAVFAATGFHKSRNLEIPNENSDGVHAGVNLLDEIITDNSPDLGDKVAVIGGGNTAMDVARSVLRLGSTPIVLYRRTRREMPAISEEIDEAIEEGIEIRYLVSPTSVIEEDGKVSGLRYQKMELGEPDSSGRRRPVPVEGTEDQMEVTDVVTAIGETSDLSYLDNEVETTSWSIKTDEIARTNIEGVFAGGDVVTGDGTVTHAIGSGKKAAMSIHSYLSDRETPPFEEKFYVFPRDLDGSQTVDFEDLNTAYSEDEERLKTDQIEPRERTASFKEVNREFSIPRAIKESLRCFHCGTCDECDNCYNYCPDMSILREVKEGEGAFSVDTSHCKGCGVCAEECPTNVITLEEVTR